MDDGELFYIVAKHKYSFKPQRLIVGKNGYPNRIRQDFYLNGVKIYPTYDMAYKAAVDRYNQALSDAIRLVEYWGETLKRLQAHKNKDLFKKYDFIL